MRIRQTQAGLQGLMASGRRLQPDLAAQRVEHEQLPLPLDMPEGPAVAGGEALGQRADLVDRADHRPSESVPSRTVAARRSGASRRARSRRLDEARFEQRQNGTRGSLRLRARRRRPRAAAASPRRCGRGGLGVLGLALDADEVAAERAGHGPGRAGAEEGIEDHVAGIGRRQDHARQQRFGFLGRCAAWRPCRPSGAPRRCRAQMPVRAHLKVFVAGLHRLVVEGVALFSERAAQISVSCALVKRRPRKFGIGWPCATPRR